MTGSEFLFPSTTSRECPGEVTVEQPIVDGGGVGATSASEERPPFLVYKEQLQREEGAEDGQVNLLTGAHKRTAYALTFEIERLGREYGIERLGFLTLTFADAVIEKREAMKRFRSLVNGVLNDRYERWIRVAERQKSGRWHFHLVVVVPEDIRTGIDFAAIADGVYRSANDALREEWAFWRVTALSLIHISEPTRPY